MISWCTESSHRFMAPNCATSWDSRYLRFFFAAGSLSRFTHWKSYSEIFSPDPPSPLRKLQKLLDRPKPPSPLKKFLSNFFNGWHVPQRTLSRCLHRSCSLQILRFVNGLKFKCVITVFKVIFKINIVYQVTDERFEWVDLNFDGGCVDDSVKHLIEDVKGVIKYLINKYHMTGQLNNRGVQLVDFFIK